jgi:hypothetical protein
MVELALTAAVFVPFAIRVPVTSWVLWYRPFAVLLAFALAIVVVVIIVGFRISKLSVWSSVFLTSLYLPVPVVV